MNQRNVEALLRLLEDYPRGLALSHVQIAGYLASCGVLVPSALTESIRFSASGFADCPLCGDDLRKDRLVDSGVEELERIAKGEA